MRKTCFLVFNLSYVGIIRIRFMGLGLHCPLSAEKHSAPLLNCVKS